MLFQGDDGEVTPVLLSSAASLKVEINSELGKISSLLHWAGSTLVLGETSEHCCEARGKIRTRGYETRFDVRIKPACHFGQQVTRAGSAELGKGLSIVRSLHTYKALHQEVLSFSKFANLCIIPFILLSSDILVDGIRYNLNLGKSPA